MKKFWTTMLFVAFVSSICLGAFTQSIDDSPTYKNSYRWTGKSKDLLYDWAQEVEDRLIGTTAVEQMYFSPTDSPTGTSKGTLYYDLSEEKLKYRNASTWVAIEAGSSGNSLDGAYDAGSAVTVDSATVGLTATNAGDVIALTVTQQDTGATVAQSIVSAGTGALLSFDSNGAGADILGSDSTWTVTKAGVATVVGLVTSTGDVTFTGANYNIIHDASADQIEFNDSAELSFGTGEDISIAYDGVGNDLDITGSGLEIAIGANDEGMDVVFHGETASTNMLWDESADELLLTLADLKISQGSQIEFIDVTDGLTDWTIDNATDETLLIYPTETTDDQSINLGTANNTSDLRIFGATASTVVFDASADNVLFNAYDIQLQDDDVLAFGDGKDVIISQSSANLLTIGQTVAGTGSVAFGVDDAGLDVKLFGDTASAYWLWDTSEDTMTVVGGNATVTTDDAEADQFKVDATGAIAGDAINFETTDGGIMLNADGAANGDIELNSADDLILTSAGKVTITNTEAVTVSGALTVAGTTTLNGVLAGDGATEVVGTKYDVVTDIDDETLTIAESGTVFDNAGDADGTVFTLPEGSTAIGCWYTFVVVAAQALNINPADGTDRFISPITNAAGDSIESSTAGDSVTVLCIGNDSWVITSAYPAATDWTDAN